MQILTYPSVHDSELKKIWHIYFKKRSIFSDYSLACHIEDSLFNYGVNEVAVLVFVDETTDSIKGILPSSYEFEKKIWCYYPSYIFISADVSIDPECWEHLPKLLPKPFIIYESSIKTILQLSKLKIPWLKPCSANAIDLTSHTYTENPFNAYLNTLTKKVKARFRNCLNKNADIHIHVDKCFDKEVGKTLRECYLNYCNEKFVEGQDFNYFKNQLDLFPLIFEKASNLNQLVSLQLYLDNQLVALNYSILDETYLYDYICYRNTNPELDKRSLGTYAILQNIKWLLDNYHNTSLYYDLASEFSYKKQFIPENNTTQYIKHIFE